MNPKTEFHRKDVAKKGLPGDLIMLGVIAPLAGLGAGLVGALFRLTLEEANRFRDVLIVRIHIWCVGGFVLWIALAAGAAAIAAWLVRRIAPSAAGSGIPRVIAALAASAAAIWVGRAITGNAPEYTVGPLTEPGFLKVPFFILLGIGAGLAGMLYNRTLLATLRTANRFPTLPVELRAAAIGSSVGVIAWFASSLVGSGDGLAQQALNGTGTLAVLPILFLFRLGLIVCSVAAGTPGGLLVPLLALGAELGLWFGLLFAFVLPGMALEPQGFAVVGMAALFTGILRAPFTAIVLVTEMTANVTMLLPMIVACFAAMLVPTLFGDMPILDSLRERLLARSKRVMQDSSKDGQHSI